MRRHAALLALAALGLVAGALTAHALHAQTARDTQPSHAVAEAPTVCGLGIERTALRPAPSGWGDTLRLFWLVARATRTPVSSVRLIEHRAPSGYDWRCRGIVIDWQTFTPEAPDIVSLDTSVARVAPIEGRDHGFLPCALAAKTRAWLAWPSQTLVCGPAQADSGILVWAPLPPDAVWPRARVRYEVLVAPCGHRDLLTADTALAFTTSSGAQARAATGRPARCPARPPAARAPRWPTRRVTVLGDETPTTRINIGISPTFPRNRDGSVQLQVGDSMDLRVSLRRVAPSPRGEARTPPPPHTRSTP